MVVTIQKKTRLRTQPRQRVRVFITTLTPSIPTSGLNDYIGKPFEPDALIAKLRQHLG